jgi:protein-L-isoaspartate(D-aspartate) O-methyltransferase
VSRPADPEAAARRLDDAFAAAPRELFLPPAQRRFAGTDQALPIGHGQTNSQPSTVRAMLTLLEAQPGQRILDVGSGSGWTTALLGRLVGPDGAVYGVERIAELVQASRAAIGGLTMPWVRVDQATDVLGRPAAAPYDRILVSAESREVPSSLVAQLVEDGVMVLPVTGRMARVRRRRGDAETTWHGHYRFVPLVHGG